MCSAWWILDKKTDKDIVKFVEEKEIARNALQISASNATMSSYTRKHKLPENNGAKKKLALQGIYKTCHTVISVFEQY